MSRIQRSDQWRVRLIPTPRALDIGLDAKLWELVRRALLAPQSSTNMLAYKKVPDILQSTVRDFLRPGTHFCCSRWGKFYYLTYVEEEEFYQVEISIDAFLDKVDAWFSPAV